MKTTGRKRKEPRLVLDGDQPHLYRKRRIRRRDYAPVEDKKDRLMHLDGDRPHIYKRRRVDWRSVIKWGSLALLALIIVLSVLGYVWLKVKESEMRVPGIEEVLDRKRKGQPETTLVMGVDKGSVPGEEEGSPSRSDIMMLVSVAADGKKAAVISIPRDTRLTLPGFSGYRKINEAHYLGAEQGEWGGTKLAIETVKEFTGLPVNHFVEIDFEGFKRIVDAVGGVPMHLDKAINDRYAGRLPAGDLLLNGDQALVLVRARHDVASVPGGDLDRIKNQQRFIQSMLSTVARQRNPFRIKKMIDTISASVKTDLTFMNMLSLGRRLQGGLGSGTVQMTTAPGRSKIIGGGWYYIVDEAQFQALIEAFRTRTEVEDVVPPPQPQEGSQRSAIRVKVLNGSGRDGLAGSVAGILTEKGYPDVKKGTASTPYGKTTIYYSSGGSAGAGIVAADLEGASEPLIKQSDSLTDANGVDVLVVLGSDYER